MSVDITALSIDKEHLSKVQKNLEYNGLIGSYYSRYSEEQNNERDTIKIDNKLERLSNCNRFWNIDRYDEQRVKDFIKTNLCRDKFCNNCKKVKQAERMANFMPEIEKYKHFNMSQLVLTVPNCTGEQLHATIKKMFKAFATLIEYFKLKKKIKGYDFSWLGYQGAIRSLEVTYKKKEYHPHLHVLVIHEGTDSEKKNLNVYSVDKYQRRDKRYFSDFEILIQKIWYLLINEQRVVKSAIEGLDLGYSCMMDKFEENDFLELFKYMTKADGLEDGKIMTYQNFKDLHEGLHSVRQIQGYGCLFRIKDEDLSILADEKYEEILNQLKQKEEPINCSETVKALLEDNEYTLISRKKIYKHLREL